MIFNEFYSQPEKSTLQTQQLYHSQRVNREFLDTPVLKSIDSKIDFFLCNNKNITYLNIMYKHKIKKKLYLISY